MAVRPACSRLSVMVLLLGILLAPLGAEARKARPQPSERDRSLAALLKTGSLDQLQLACQRLLEEGDGQGLQRVQARLLQMNPSPQPLPVVLANAAVLLDCKAPQAALKVLERYGPAPGAERRQWLLLQWQAANAGLDHRVAAEALKDLADGQLAQLETLQLPLRFNDDGSVASRSALDLLAAHLVALGQPRAAADVLLAARTPGEATARRIAEAVQLLPSLPLADQVRLLEIALDQAAASGSWGLVTDLLDRQLALPDTPVTAAARQRAADRRLRLSRRIDDAYGEWRVRRSPELEVQLRSPRSAGGHAAPSTPAPQP